jgi:KDO2-lipid IV(A) lauroyltransferase
LGTEYIDAAHAAGKGVIFLTPHLGCFEITPQAYAARYAAEGRSIAVLYRPPRQAVLAPLLEQGRSRPGMAGAPASLGGIKQMIKALKSGQAVGLLPDQVPPDGMGVWAPFFGRDAYTMTLAAKLAAQTGATLLLAVGERLPRGRGYRVWVEPAPADLPAEPQAAAACINQWMQALIRRYPQQYLWGYARYKAPKKGL